MRTILCIDDDPITLMLCKKVIQKASFAQEILTAYNGEEALELLKNLSDDPNKSFPELILLDLNMPILNGWDFLEIYSASEIKKCPIIILSSTIDPTDFNRAKDYNLVKSFYSKPITIDVLEEIKAKTNSNEI